MSAVLTLLATAFVGGLALLAQSARKSRGAEVTLIVVLLALSLLISALGTVTGLGLVLEATSEGGTGSPRLAFAAAGVAALLVGLVGVGLCVPPLLKVLGYRAGAGFWADPPVFLALWLFVMVLANNALSFLIFTQTPDVSQLFPTGRLSPATMLTSQLPFVVVALLGVGLGVRRNPRETLHRLGYGAISARQAGVVALFVVAALIVAATADSLFSRLQPDLYRQVGELSESLFNPAGMSPLAAVLFALMVGIGAGLGEETLFRGALQPVLGIVPTSVLFASMHVQYGPSLLLGYVFLLSVGLGLLRRHFNTTASFLAHAAYNSVMVLLAHFFGM
ncbi:MAG TPA: CPBP family intramembrane glutamic endopeptidase [Rubrobacteraceae bacterium]|nr:CPBP family intramembrane glutamic endopeptidase [Rubrobacteraceae bacterium]